jgi:hypothetical protein
MIDGKSLDQIPSAAANPLRPTQEQIIKAVAAAAGLPERDAMDRAHQPESFQVAAYLLRRAANVPLKNVAEMGSVSPGRISQIQREIEDAGGLAKAVPWASGLATSYLEI